MRDTMQKALARIAERQGAQDAPTQELRKAKKSGTKDAEDYPSFDPPTLEHIRQVQLAQYKLTLDAIQRDIIKVLQRA